MLLVEILLVVQIRQIFPSKKNAPIKDTLLEQQKAEMEGRQQQLVLPMKITDAIALQNVLELKQPQQRALDQQQHQDSNQVLAQEPL